MAGSEQPSWTDKKGWARGDDAEKEIRRQQKAARESTETLRHWKVAEQFSEAKDNERGTEDDHVITEDCIAVLDGVTSNVSGEGETPGQFAVRIGLEAIRNAKNLDPHQIATLLSNTLRDALAEHPREGVPSFVFVAFFPRHNVIVRVGDCSYLIDKKGNNPELSVDYARAVLRKRALNKRLARGADVNQLAANDPMKERVAGLKSWQEHFSNNPKAKDFGYGVVNGTDIPGVFIEYIPVPDDARSVVLASDGYPPQTLHSTLEETETALRELQSEDPLGIEGAVPSIRVLKPAPGQSASDDRTYVRIER